MIILISFIIINITISLSLPITEENNYSANVSPSLLVKHYDCQERQNLQRYNLVAVDECEKSTSTAEHNHALVKLYARATSQEIPAFFCEIKKKNMKKLWVKKNIT